MCTSYNHGPPRVLRLLMGSSGNLAAVYSVSPAAQRINGCSVASLLCCLHQTPEYICRPTLKQSVDKFVVGKAAAPYNSKCKYKLPQNEPLEKAMRKLFALNRV